MGLLAIALVVLIATIGTVDAGCCGCCGCCCPCCCCKPIVIKLPPPPTKICPCCCCCKPCCCCCCKPCCCCCCKPCCCCCPCCCCGGGGGRRKRDVVNIAAKKFSDLFLPQHDAIGMPQNICNCNQCNQRGPSPCGASQNQFPFTAQQQQQQNAAAPLCGNAGGCGCGGYSAGNLINGMGGIPPIHQLPIIHNQMGGSNLNSFHANGGGFGSNLMNGGNHMIGANEPINLMDGCGGGGNGCVGCNGNGNGCQSNDCMMYGNCGQFGNNGNGCRRRRRRNTLFAEAASSAVHRRKNQRSNGNVSGAELANSSDSDTEVPKRKKEQKIALQKKRQRHSKLKPALRRKAKLIKGKNGSGSH